jgi:hypothetical protein
MSSSAVDGSEDVNDFLQRIKELNDKRDQEDEERNRKLEEEILQGKKERQARRAGKLIQFHGKVLLGQFPLLLDPWLITEFRTSQINLPHKVFSCEHPNFLQNTCGTN